MNESFKVDERHSIRYQDGDWTVYKDGQPLNDLPEQLSKYYSLSDRSIESLQSCFFSIRNPRHFNDPFDCCANLIKEKQVISVSGLPDPIINDMPSVGVSCFSTKDTDPLMWAHYARSYSGFVTTIETEFTIANLPEFESHYLSRVIYTDSPNPVSEKMPYSDQYRLTTKLKNWEYENEWRLIVQKADGHFDFDRFYFARQSVKEILVGYKLNPKLNPKEVDLQERFWSIIRTNYAGVPIFQVGPANDSFNLYKRRVYFAEDVLNLD